MHGSSQNLTERSQSTKLLNSDLLDDVSCSTIDMDAELHIPGEYLNDNEKDLIFVSTEMPVKFDKTRRSVIEYIEEALTVKEGW